MPVSGLIIVTQVIAAVTVLIGVGGGGAETAVIEAAVHGSTTGIQMPFPTPMKFSSGTRITVRAANTTTFFSFIGWEE